jgi:hypothetical protein
MLRPALSPDIPPNDLATPLLVVTRNIKNGLHSDQGLWFSDIGANGVPGVTGVGRWFDLGSGNTARTIHIQS